MVAQTPVLSSKGYRLRRVLIVRVLHCAGLMAWIVEKFRTWSDCNGDVESRFTKDELLTNVSLYWFNQNITSSTRLYYETMGPFAKPDTFHQGPVKARTLSLFTHIGGVNRMCLSRV